MSIESPRENNKVPPIQPDSASKIGNTALRIFISPTRSGSTALLRCFENNPEVDMVYHQPIKSGYRQDGVFDYKFFDLENDAKDRIYVAKETVGGFASPETEFSPLPNAGHLEKIGPWVASPKEINKIEPLILVRDPLSTWASIDSLNRYSEGISEYYSPFDFFVRSYKKVVEFMVAAKDMDLSVHCITHELLGNNPQEHMPKICANWNIGWYDSMINWNQPHGIKTWLSEEAKDRMNNDPRFRKSKESLEASHKYEYFPSNKDDVSDLHKRVIENELRELYLLANDYALADFVNRPD